MKILLTALLVVHGFIHLMGPAKAWGLAELPQLKQPISKGLGLLWLAAALLLLGTAAALFLAPGWWWELGAVALVVSQGVILSSWSDARYGTIANLLLLAAVVHGVVTRGS